MVLEIFTKRKGAMQMKKTKCQSCGMSEYKQDGNVYTCIYCNAQYEESGGALKMFLNFTERQLDKMREASKENNKNLLNFTERQLDKMREAKKEKEEKEKVLRESRRKAGVCQYCGHHFYGIFKKTCSKCGKAKDY